MGKGPLVLIIIGLFALIFAIVLTIIPVISPIVIPNPANMGNYWFSGIVRAFVIGVLYSELR